jgi:hypothetical protein
MEKYGGRDTATPLNATKAIRFHPNWTAVAMQLD